MPRTDRGPQARPNPPTAQHRALTAVHITVAWRASRETCNSQDALSIELKRQASFCPCGFGQKMGAPAI